MQTDYKMIEIDERDIPLEFTKPSEEWLQTARMAIERQRRERNNRDMMCYRPPIKRG